MVSGVRFPSPLPIFYSAVVLFENFIKSLLTYGPMVKRLRHRPFTAVSRVRIPVGSPDIWAISSAGRASALQAGGHRFEPCIAHHIFLTNKFLTNGPVVQLVRMPACHAGGRRFKSVPGRQVCWCSSIGRATDL